MDKQEKELYPSLREIEQTIKYHRMDAYHRFLLEWLVNEVKRLTDQLKVVHDT